MTQRAEAFVQAVEVWVPDGEHRLRHHSGAYGDHTEFARVSARKHFRKGEGLPGHVWRVERPVVWKELGSLFVRAELARDAGIEAAIGVPVFCGSVLTAVLVLLCGRRTHTLGCIEIWDVHAEQGRAVHGGGYYGKLDRFERISALVEFGAGCGLPGLVWERGAPEVMENLASDALFTRGTLARESGLSAGLGIPIYRDGRVAHVLVLLSAEATPLARAFEIWTVESDAPTLHRAMYADAGAALSANERLVHPAGQVLPRDALAARVPVVFEHRLDNGVELGVAIPVDDGERVRSVVVLAI